MVSCSTLAAKIVQKGLGNMDFSMLTPHLKHEILTATGEAFFKQGNIKDAVRSFMIANNTDKMVEIGDWFIAQTRFEEAALFFIPTGNKKVLEKVGFECADRGNLEMAIKCFEAAGNQALVEFIKANS